MYDIGAPSINGVPLCPGTGEQGSPAISGRKIVWQDNRNAATGFDIYMFDLDNPGAGAQIICDAPGNQVSPDISGNIIVWTDCRNDPEDCWGEIYMYDLGDTDPVENGEPVCTILANAGEPTVSGNIILWIDRRDASHDGQIYMYDLAHPVTNGRALCPSSDPQGPATISGNNVAWEEYNSVTGADIYRTNIQDTMPPITTATISNGPHCGWYHTPAYVMLSWADPCGGSGVALTEYSMDGVDWTTYGGCHDIEITADGEYTVYYRSTDYAGNVEAPKSVTFKVDGTPPMTTSVSGATDGGWYNHDVTLTFSATDMGGSGLYNTEYSFDGGATIDTIPADGLLVQWKRTVSYRSKDNAMNTETPWRTIAVNIDKDYPITTATVASTAGSHCGWYLGPVTVTLSAIDPCSGSGIAETQYSMNGVDWMTYGPDPIQLNDEGVYTVYYRSIDQVDNVETAQSVTIQIDMAEPKMDSMVQPVDPKPMDSEITITIYFNDMSDLASIIWDWGDGTTPTAVPQQGAMAFSAPLSTPSSSLTATHVYTQPGVYLITVTVTDNAGHMAIWTSSNYVVVYDPSGGFVTGGGWINSPSGAYVADPALTGKANFGFVAKYKKGTIVPDGNTEFQFKAGNLDFASTAYDWLVVAGQKAMFKGTGTVNGEGNYEFLLSAIDGSPDRFRIKIWQEVSGGEQVVYDNNLLDGGQNVDPVAALGGGSIVVHK